jgi:hypothetical protein
MGGFELLAAAARVRRPVNREIPRQPTGADSPVTRWMTTPSGE